MSETDDPRADKVSRIAAQLPPPPDRFTLVYELAQQLFEDVGPDWQAAMRRVEALADEIADVYLSELEEIVKRPEQWSLYFEEPEHLDRLKRLAEQLPALPWHDQTDAVRRLRLVTQADDTE